ncbi:epoxyqueuosine reductase QueH [Desulfobotulus mexicanus]|uniref:Epoxyqueuosine reductase QueH n=1 Tax=Desulfobotulus mexicanus TaxID=2586642 RepID=A0A5Q4VH91_9BACT|nr:epoxyqueuosine reductase QueH [Desulfobotulus mexicanus]TYT75540.1 epoxyqueuosine reductase QueH [Desulfobotulus mexicanus]
MKILLHTCCGPCTIYPLKTLREEGHSLMGFFYRHNIHPLTECLRREETMKEYALEMDMKVIFQEGYELEEFLQSMVFREKERCRICYHKRLTATALLAKRGKFDAFSTTLLYSRFQNHALIRDTGEAAGKSAGIPFFYRDFREGWQEGIETSKEKGMYRQSYCGCIYSEKDRYFRAGKKN